MAFVLRGSRVRRAILALMVVAALALTALLVFGASSASATHCWHHHPDHHYRAIDGVVYHHFHISHDWWYNGDSFWSASSADHICP